MATDVPMPKLGLTMEEATIIEWLVADGVAVDIDQPILRIETDKTETEVGSPGAGRTSTRSCVISITRHDDAPSAKTSPTDVSNTISSSSSPTRAAGDAPATNTP